MKKRFPGYNFTGLDINEELIKEGNSFLQQENIGCKIEYGDLYNLDIKKLANRFEGVISYQTLSWLPEYEKALLEMIKLNPNWISLTSLFYDGLVDCKIEIQEFSSPKDKKSDKTCFYNIYSLPRVENFFFENGYQVFKSIPFEIDIDLPKPEHSKMQTYTQKIVDENKRLQISGPLLMSWVFIYAAKKPL